MRITEQLTNLESETEVPKCVGCWSSLLARRKRFKMSKKTPEKETPIIIWYDDREEDFEASLLTYRDCEKNGETSNRHFLVKVVETGPAGLMKIKNCDEILAINDDGVPDKTHDEVVGIFNKIKVDGETRFNLVLRRRPEGKWIWLKTSAILAPESTSVHDHKPFVKKTDFKKLDNNYTESTTNNRYKILGTQRYLGIRDRQVMTSVLSDCHDGGTDANMMCKILRYWQDGEGHVYFQAALCDEGHRNYIGVDKDKKKIIVKNEPEWFNIQELDSEIEFKVNGLYLGYNEQEDQVDAQTTNFRFEEIPGEVEVSQLTRLDGKSLPHNSFEKLMKVSRNTSTSSSDSDNTISSISSSSSDDT